MPRSPFVTLSGLAVVAMLALAPAAQAQTAAPAPAPSEGLPNVSESHAAIAVDVLKASGMMTMFDNAMPNAIPQLRTNITRQRPELARDIEASIKEIEAKLPEFVNDGVTRVGRFLAARMTEAELKEVRTFLTSPVGKKYVDALPGFMDQVVPFLQEWNRAVNEAILTGFQAEMLKRGHRL